MSNKGATAQSQGSKTAQKQFEVENKVKDIGNDEFYTYDQQQ